jgi:hypothetical protein
LPPRYSWNIVETDTKHLNATVYNQSFMIYVITKSFLVWHWRIKWSSIQITGLEGNQLSFIDGRKLEYPEIQSIYSSYPLIRPLLQCKIGLIGGVASLAGTIIDYILCYLVFSELSIILVCYVCTNTGSPFPYLNVTCCIIMIFSNHIWTGS